MENNLNLMTIPKIKIWAFLDENFFLKKDYNKELIQQFQNLIIATKNYVVSRQIINSQVEYSEKYLKYFYYQLFKFDFELEISFHNLIEKYGLRYRIGFEYAKYLIINFQRELKLDRPLISKEIKRINTKINRAIKNGYWKNYGIKKLSDFQVIVLGKNIRNTTGYYTNNIELAILDVLSYQKNNKIDRALLSKEIAKNFPGILNAINKGYWIKYGIRRYRFSDFQLLAFGKTTNKPKKNYRGKINDKKSDVYRGYYSKKIGLEKAVLEVQKYQKENDINRPLFTVEIKNNFPGIITSIDSGNWIKFGIRRYSISDFQQLAFGMTNRKENGYYKSRSGLDKAIEEVRNLQKKLKLIRPLTQVEIKKQFEGILTAIKRGYWVEFGVGKGKVSDFIQIAFLES